MKKIFILLLFFLSSYAFSNSYGVQYSIGQDIIYNDGKKIKLPNQFIGFEYFSSEIPHAYFLAGYNTLLSKQYYDNQSETDFSTNIGFSADAGYVFARKIQSAVFSAIPCLSYNSFSTAQNKYTEFNVHQAGIKLNLGIETCFKHFNVRFSFAPQYSFINYISMREKNSMTAFFYDTKSASYNEQTLYYSKHSSILSAEGFQYRVGLSLMYRF